METLKGLMLQSNRLTLANANPLPETYSIMCFFFFFPVEVVHQGTPVIQLLLLPPFCHIIEPSAATLVKQLAHYWCHPIK